jgi:hypothetical protein
MKYFNIEIKSEKIFYQFDSIMLVELFLIHDHHLMIGKVMKHYGIF